MRLSEEHAARLFLRGTVRPVEDHRSPVQKVPEAQFMAELIRLARLYGWLHYHTHDSRHSPRGFPDLTLVRPEPGRGPVLALELKSETGKLTIEQQMWLRALDGKQVSARLVRPHDLAALVRLLQGRT